MTLLELTDATLLQTNRRSQQLFREAAERAGQAVQSQRVVGAERREGQSLSGGRRQRLARARAPGPRGARRHCGDAVPTPPVGAAWSPLVHDLDPKSGYRAFEACALMSLRRSLRRGSVWVDHSMVFRDRKALLISDDEWTAKRDQHLQILGHPSDPREFIGPLLAAVSAGLSALAEAVQRGRVEIGADRLLHIPPLSALPDDIEPRKTREAVFQRIGDVQLPDILMEVDAATHFSEALLARRADSTDELFALYGALLSHGTDNDAKGVRTMIPGSTWRRSRSRCAHWSSPAAYVGPTIA